MGNGNEYARGVVAEFMGGEARHSGVVPARSLSPLEVKLDRRLAEFEARHGLVSSCPEGNEHTDRCDVPIYKETVSSIPDATDLTDVPSVEVLTEPVRGIPRDSAARKRTPLCTGLLDYAPAALDMIAHAAQGEFPNPDAAGFVLENELLNALRYRDHDGAPNWSMYRRVCLAALAILHREITGDPMQAPGAPGLACMLCTYADAFAAVAQVSWHGNNKHNPGQPLHHAREKSTDHADCIVRHAVDNMRDPGGYDGEFMHAAALVWRCLILTQIALEASGTPKARGAR